MVEMTPPGDGGNGSSGGIFLSHPFFDPIRRPIRRAYLAINACNSGPPFVVFSTYTPPIRSTIYYVSEQMSTNG